MRWSIACGLRACQLPKYFALDCQTSRIASATELRFFTTKNESAYLSSLDITIYIYVHVYIPHIMCKSKENSTNSCPIVVSNFFVCHRSLDSLVRSCLLVSCILALCLSAAFCLFLSGAISVRFSSCISIKFCARLRVLFGLARFAFASQAAATVKSSTNKYCIYHTRTRTRTRICICICIRAFSSVPAITDGFLSK